MLNLNGLWLLDRDVFEAMQEQYSQLLLDPKRFAAFIEQVSGGGEDGPVLMIQDGTAHIPIIGPITKAPNMFFSMFGGGSSVYGDIAQAVRATDANPDVERIVLQIDSPGGELDGMFETARVIQGVTTRVEAQITDQALSAAFGLAAQADLITLNNPMARVGSVGVMSTQFVSDQRVSLRSTNAPRKNPDPTTKAGAASIVSELDTLHTEFVELIAAGRSAAAGKTVTAETVNQDFGRGGIVMAKDALAAGMIDAISSGSIDGGSRPPAVDPDSPSTEMTSMTREELKAEFPAVYAAIFDSGREAGQTTERERVSAHVIAGEELGVPHIAMSFIKDGAEFSSPVVQAKYMTAGRNVTDTSDRDKDDKDADAGSGTQNAGDVTAEASAAKEATLWAGVRSGMGLSASAG